VESWTLQRAGGTRRRLTLPHLRSLSPRETPFPCSTTCLMMTIPPMSPLGIMRSTVLLLVLVACATGGPNEQPMREDRVSLHDSEGQIFDVSLQRQDYVQQSTFDLPSDSLWVRIPDALRDVG